jgi:predicted amidophosphoribosyltransferase
MTVLISILLALVAFAFIAYPFFRRTQALSRQSKSARGTGVCPKCGAEQREDDFFCPRCGASLIETAENDE